METENNSSVMMITV